MPTALANSCNPAFVTLALRMGMETFYKYLRAFGLGVKTGVDLPGESAGILISPKYVKNVDLARIGFGQSVAVTPLQLITAACICLFSAMGNPSFMHGIVRSFTGGVS